MLPPSPCLIIRMVAGSPGSVTWSNVSYWSPVGSFNVTSINAAADDAMGVIGTPMAQCLRSNSYVFNCVTEYINGTTRLIGNTVIAPVVGAQGGTSVSDQNAVVIRKLTGLAGRSNAGRMFLSSMSSIQFDNSNPDELAVASVGDFEALAAVYAADRAFGGVTCHSRHWNRLSGTLVPIIACKVSSRVASRDDRRRHAPNIPV